MWVLVRGGWERGVDRPEPRPKGGLAIVRRSTLGFMLAIAVGLGFFSVARAQGPDVQIAQLDCNSEPEVVVIQNRGDAAQDTPGWKLESDPPGDEVFNLFGTLKP